MENKEQSISDSVLEKIKTNKISMRPRIYFSFKLALVLGLVFAVLFVSVMLCNFIFFSIRLSGHEELLQFGGPGWVLFLRVFPWSLLLVDVVLIIVLEILLRQFRFGYRSPILYLLIGLLALTLSVSFLFDRVTSINDRLYVRAERHTLPAPFIVMYGHARRLPPPDAVICHCVITQINDDSIIVYNSDMGTTTEFRVVLPPERAEATSTFHTGDTLFIAGPVSGGTIRAFGVRVLNTYDRQ